MSGSCSCIHRILGAVNPVSASLPVIWIRRSSPMRADFITLRACTLIVPQHSGAQHLACLIEQYQPVHLTCQTDCGNILTMQVSLRERITYADDDTLPPIGGVLLRPQWLRPGKSQRHRS